MMKKNIVRIVILILWILSIFFSFYVGRCYEWASTTVVHDTKCFNEILVEKNEIADYNVFTEIPEKYGALEQIPESIRKTISLYMQANNLKLKEGIHSFDRLYGTLDDYINEQFVFEPIK